MNGGGWMFVWDQDPVGGSGVFEGISVLASCSAVGGGWDWDG